MIRGGFEERQLFSSPPEIIPRSINLPDVR